jgi:hypothetical protein
MRKTKSSELNPSDGEEEDENEFYDAVAESAVSSAGVNDSHFTLNIPTGTSHRRNSSDSSSEPDEATETKQVCINNISPNPKSHVPGAVAATTNFVSIKI